jgi:hypothetical protein
MSWQPVAFQVVLELAAGAMHVPRPAPVRLGFQFGNQGFDVDFYGLLADVIGNFGLSRQLHLGSVIQF